MSCLKRFPYPRHTNPTPHQIFHLPPSATQPEIKARYYDLVRVYHPDKYPSASSAEAHARFQAITAAYHNLRRRPLSPASATSHSLAPTTAAYRTMQRRRQDLYHTGAVDDSTLDNCLVAGLVATVLFVLIHNLTTRRAIMADVVSRSRSAPSSREAEAKLSMDPS